MVSARLQLVKRISYGVRWVLEIALIWALVLPETGVWTCVLLTLITAGIEIDHLNPSDWSKS